MCNLPLPFFNFEIYFTFSVVFEGAENELDSLKL